MQSIILTEVGKCQERIKKARNDANNELYHRVGEEQLVESLETMMKLWKISKDEGLLVLGENYQHVCENKFIVNCLAGLIPIVVDNGGEERFVELAMLKYFRDMYCEYDALSYLMLVVGFIYMIRGDGRLEQTLSLMFPKSENIEKRYSEKAKEREELEMAEFLERGQAAFDRVCRYKSPQPTPHTKYIYESNELIQAMDYDAINLFLRNVDNTTLAVAMTQYSGLTNKHILSHVSSRLRVAMALEIESLKKKDAADVNTVSVNMCCRNLIDVMSKLGII